MIAGKITACKDGNTRVVTRSSVAGHEPDCLARPG